MFLLFLLSFLTGLNGLGMIVPETPSKVKQLGAEITKLQENGESMDAILNVYLKSTACVRFETQEDIISIGIEIDREITNQIVSFVVIDNSNNILRSSTLKNKVTKLGIGFDGDFINICFENYRINQSWKVKSIDVMVMIDIKLGIGEIIREAKQSDIKIGRLVEEYIKLGEEIKGMTNFWININSIEHEIRDLNEAILEKVSIYSILVIFGVISVSIYQIQWILNIIKSHGLHVHRI